MDRRLLTFAIIAFSLELMLFLSDVDLLSWTPFSRPAAEIDRPQIGEVQMAQQNVRRRGFDSNLWEDSVSKDHLFENDSILTLSGSSAKLKLQGNINIELHENTLVVLEHLETNLDKPFRLRFSHGDLRAQNKDRGVVLKSGDWAISATPGADLSLRATEKGRVEVEVSSGQVEVQHTLNGLRQKITSEQKMILSPEEISDVVVTSPDLKWDLVTAQKIYAHSFPISANFSWQGHAQTIEILSPSKGKETLPLPSGRLNADLKLQPGSYHLTLHGYGLVSRTLSVQVIKAPKIVHLTPLPRDRIKTHESHLFAWLSEMSLPSYKVEFARDENFKQVVHEVTSTTPRLQLTVPVEGDLFWRIIGVDEENFLIPAAYSYSIFSHPDPLSAPQLRTPTSIEKKKGATYKPQKLFKWTWLWQALLPQAEAQYKPVPPVIFNWEALAGADHYIIEISTSSNFEKPEVIAKVSTPYYAWTNFNKQIYYYRVAGGSQSGRVGVFSQPEKVDLTIWPPPPAPTQPTPQVLSPVTPPSTPVVPKVATTPLVSDVAPVAPIPPQAPPSPAPPLPPSSSPPSLSEENRDKSDAIAENPSFWWRGIYQSEKQTGPQNVTADLTGGSWMAFGFSVDLNLLSNKIFVAGDWQNIEWQPRSKTKWPFQKKITTSTWHGKLAFSENNFYYGAVVQQSARLSRADLEQVRTETELGYGPLVGWHQVDGVIAQSHELFLTVNSGFTELTSSNFLQYNFRSRLFLGAELQLATSFGSTRSSLGQMGLQVGFRW